MTAPVAATLESDRASLCDVLDRLLTTGVVLQGEVVISVADVDLLYAGLNLVLASTDTIHRFRRNT